MTISEVIFELQEIRKREGDLLVMLRVTVYDPVETTLTEVEQITIDEDSVILEAG